MIDVYDFTITTLDEGVVQRSNFQTFSCANFKPFRALSRHSAIDAPLIIVEYSILCILVLGQRCDMTYDPLQGHRFHQCCTHI